MKQRGRLLSIILIICLAAGLMPNTAFAVRKTTRTVRTASARAAGTKGAVQIVDAAANPTGGIQGYDETKGYHYVYFGTKDDNPIKWRVLETQTSGGSSNSSSIFLLSEDLQGEVVFGSSGSGNTWQGSTAQEWCKVFAGDSTAGSVTSPFSSMEKDALLEVSSGGLSNDKVFFLSEDEAKQEKYGFSKEEKGDSARIAEAGGTEADWWLRTAATGNDVKAVDKTGAITSKGDGSTLQARPAFNLDMGKVLFTAPAGGTTTRAAGGLNKVSSEAASEWRLVLKDDSRNGASGFTAKPATGSSAGSSTDPVPANTGDTVTVSYENAKTGNNEYVSAMLEDSTGNILYYGQIEDCSAAGSEKGDVTIKIPEDLASGSYKLKVFNEEYDGAKQTGYASDLKDIYLTVTDTIPPTLTPGEVKRVSDTEATVKFTSSEDGTYYYKVVNHGDPEPTDIVTGTGTGCDTAEQTITLRDVDGMSSGAKDVYIVVVDAAGKKSAALKIEIPSDATPVYEISVSPEVLNFRAVEGYGQLSGENVTVKNTGNQEITLEQPVVGADSNFVIGQLSETVLAPNETAEFTVSPKTGLPAGSYPEKITISGSNGTNTRTAEVTLNFEVTARTPGKFVITASAGEGGTITPRSSSVDPGTDLTVTITPRTGYEIDTITVDGTEISKSELSDRNEYTFRNIQADHTIQVTFKAIDDEPAPTMRTLAVSASPEEGGTVAVPEGGTSGSYQDGSEVVVTATANEGYHFVRWTENDNQVSDSASYRFNIVANKNLVAVFEADTPTPASHTVTVNSSYAQTSGAGTYQTGATVTVQAGTRQNYRFDGWTTEDGITFANASSATTTFTMPDKDVTVTAKWTYTGSTGTGNGTNSGNSGTTSGNNNTTSGGNGTVSDGKGGTYTGDDTPTVMWISILCTSFGLMTVLGIFELRRRKLYPEFMGQWRGLTEKEFGQKRR